jgi:hypothetical protein
MGKRLIIVLAGGIAVSGLGMLPAAAELVPGGWAAPIQVPPPQPPAPERTVERPPPMPRVPVRRPVHRRTAPVSHALPDGQVRF